MRYLALVALVNACDAGSKPQQPTPAPTPVTQTPTMEVTRRGALYVLTTHPAMALGHSGDSCDRGFDIERRDGTQWVAAGVWYRVPKDCNRFVDEGPPSPKAYCRCEPPRGGGAPDVKRTAPVDPTSSSELTWSGNTITGPAPKGTYRLWMPGRTFEFEVR